MRVLEKSDFHWASPNAVDGGNTRGMQTEFASEVILGGMALVLVVCTRRYLLHFGCWDQLSLRRGQHQFISSRAIYCVPVSGTRNRMNCARLQC